jgi:signal transduction histidine kinase
VVATIQSTIRPDAAPKIASILSWPGWSDLADAILVDKNLGPSFSGTITTHGIDLNPLGASARSPSFDRQLALNALYEAMQTRRSIQVLGGTAIPILWLGREVALGGLWYRSKTRAVDYASVLRELLPWFGLSTLLLTWGTFLALRRIVLDPVQQLAEGARRVSSGDFSVRLPEPAGRDELAELVRSFNSMSSTVQSFNQRLSEEVRVATEKARAAEAAAMRERRLAAMGELAAGIAHEINNPLGGLSNAVEDLRRSDLPLERRAQYLDLLARGLTRIGATVNRLRRFTPRESPREPVELRAVVQDAIDLVQHRALRQKVELVLAKSDAPIRVAGAQNELGQAVLNLLMNALDALEEGGTKDPRGPRIEITLRTDAEGVSLFVRDNGPGVAPELLDKLVDLFFTTKDVGRGTGLGLALVHNAMQVHGGELRLASEPGRFFQAELRFPRVPGDGSAA